MPKKKLFIFCITACVVVLFCQVLFFFSSFFELKLTSLPQTVSRDEFIRMFIDQHGGEIKIFKKQIHQIVVGGKSYVIEHVKMPSELMGRTYKTFQLDNKDDYIGNEIIRIIDTGTMSRDIDESKKILIKWEQSNENETYGEIIDIKKITLDQLQKELTILQNPDRVRIIIISKTDEGVADYRLVQVVVNN